MKSIAAILFLSFLFCFRPGDAEATPQLTSDSLLFNLDHNLILYDSLSLYSHVELMEEAIYEAELQNAAQDSAMRLNPGRPQYFSIAYRYFRNPFRTHPSRYSRVDLGNSNWKMFALLQNDYDESSLTDLFRAGIELKHENTTLYAGDFAVNSPVGWILSTSPRFYSRVGIPRTDLSSSSLIKLNKSTEEGRGWRGIAVENGSSLFQQFLWIGKAEYDARPELDGWAPYSAQGDHYGYRERFKNEVEELHSGAALKYQSNSTTLLLSGWQSGFDKVLSSESPARFAGIRNDLSQFGLYLSQHFTKHDKLFSEISTQDGEYGGVIGVRGDRDKDRYQLTYHKVSQEFSILHSRAHTSFTSNPVNSEGAILAYESNRNYNQHLTIIEYLKYLDDRRGTTDGVLGLNYSNTWSPKYSKIRRIQMAIQSHSISNVALENAYFRFKYSSITDKGGATTRTGGEYVQLREGSAFNFFIERRHQYTRWFKFQYLAALFSGTYLRTSLVNTYFPGRMPIEYLHGSGIVLTLTTEMKLFNSLDTRFQAVSHNAVTHGLDYSLLKENLRFYAGIRYYSSFY